MEQKPACDSEVGIYRERRELLPSKLFLNPTSTLVARYGAVGRDKMSIFNAGVTYLKNSDE
jgi:hypothetical protein